MGTIKIDSRVTWFADADMWGTVTDVLDDGTVYVRRDGDQRGDDAEAEPYDAAQLQWRSDLPQACVWHEPAGAASPRGWLKSEATCIGFYLDYGPEHYRSPHEYCSAEGPCRKCQPGNVLAVRYPNGPGTAKSSRYAETVDQARRFVETGRPRPDTASPVQAPAGERSEA